MNSELTKFVSPKFALGQVVGTPEALHALAKSGEGV